MAEKSAVEQLGLRTAPFDARFPNQNQTKNCWQNFIDHQRCIKNRGEDYEPCQYFKKNFKSLCPVAWVFIFWYLDKSSFNMKRLIVYWQYTERRSGWVGFCFFRKFSITVISIILIFLGWKVERSAGKWNFCWKNLNNNFSLFKLVENHLYIL